MYIICIYIYIILYSYSPKKSCCFNPSFGFSQHPVPAPGRPVARIGPDADEFGLRILHQALSPGVLERRCLGGQVLQRKAEKRWKQKGEHFGRCDKSRQNT